MPKRKSVGLRPVLDLAKNTVTMNVVDGAGDTAKILESAIFSTQGMDPEKIVKRLTLHGLSTILQQRTSQIDEPAEKLPVMQEIVDRMLEGEWEKERVVGAPVVSVEVEALAELKKLTIPQAQKALQAYDKETRAKILANPQLAPIIKRLKEAREKTQENTLDDLLK